MLAAAVIPRRDYSRHGRSAVVELLSNDHGYMKGASKISSRDGYKALFLPGLIIDHDMDTKSFRRFDDGVGITVWS